MNTIKNRPTIIITPDRCVSLRGIFFILLHTLVVRKTVYKIIKDKGKTDRDNVMQRGSLKSNIVANHNLIILASPFETNFMLPVIHENFLDHVVKPGKCDYNFVIIEEMCANNLI